MKNLLFAFLFLCSALLPAQTLYVNQPTGYQHPGTVSNGCGVVSQHFSINRTMTACPTFAVPIGGTLQIAGAAGFLWPAGTEGPLFFAIEIAPAYGCQSLLPNYLLMPGASPLCDKVWQVAPTLFSPTWSVTVPLGGGATMNYYWLNLPVPFDPSLSAQYITHHTLHANPLTSTWMVSPRHDTIIW